MQLSAQFKLEKETKGTFRYAEETAGQPPKIGTLYVQKRALPTPPPNRITITLEALDSAQRREAGAIVLEAYRHHGR